MVCLNSPSNVLRLWEIGGKPRRAGFVNKPALQYSLVFVNVLREWPAIMGNGGKPRRACFVNNATALWGMVDPAIV